MNSLYKMSNYIFGSSDNKININQDIIDGNQMDILNTKLDEPLNVSTLDTPVRPIEHNYKHKLLYYYQTFSSLDSIIDVKKKTGADIYVYVSSIHFGNDPKTTKPYLHINNDTPDKQCSLWDDCNNAHQNGVNILLMLGGAGGFIAEAVLTKPKDCVVVI